MEQPDLSYRVIVVELSDVVPRRRGDRPNLYVGLTTMDPRTRFDLLVTGRGPSWLRGHIVTLRTDLSPQQQFADPGEARAAKSSLIKSLKSAGFTVNRDVSVWTVYVIELDNSVTREPGLGTVYVGETKKTPEERLREHLTRAVNGRTRLYSSVVARHGRRLRMDLAPDEKYFDKESSKRAEAAWAEHLRSLGYTVRGGH